MLYNINSTANQSVLSKFIIIEHIIIEQANLYVGTQIPGKFKAIYVYQ